MMARKPAARASAPRAQAAQSWADGRSRCRARPATRSCARPPRPGQPPGPSPAIPAAPRQVAAAQRPNRPGSRATPTSWKSCASPSTSTLSPPRCVFHLMAPSASISQYSLVQGKMCRHLSGEFLHSKEPVWLSQSAILLVLTGFPACNSTPSVAHESIEQQVNWSLHAKRLHNILDCAKHLSYSASASLCAGSAAGV